MELISHPTIGAQELRGRDGAMLFVDGKLAAVRGILLEEDRHNTSVIYYREGVTPPNQHPLDKITAQWGLLVKTGLRPVKPIAEDLLEKLARKVL